MSLKRKDNYDLKKNNNIQFQFVTNKYPSEIKNEPFDDDIAPTVIMTNEYDEPSHSNVRDEVLDDICIDQLCQWFNRQDKWKKLARCMDLEAFVNVWATSKNPSKMLFKFSEVSE